MFIPLDQTDLYICMKLKEIKCAGKSKPIAYRALSLNSIFLNNYNKFLVRLVSESLVFVTNLVYILISSLKKPLCEKPPAQLKRDI